MMKQFLLQSLLVAGCLLQAHAQQDPIYSQYMFNGQAINPAYASMDGSASLTAVGRNQWVGIDGAPQTATISFYSPVKATNTSLGFSAMKETITVQSRTDLNMHVSQKVKLNEKLQLAMGLQGGMSQYKKNNSQLTTTDPVFANNQRYWKTNIGFGFMLYADRFFVGLSAPAFKSFDIGNSVNKVATKAHYYMEGGYLYKVNDDVLLKPVLLLRYVDGNGLQYDINTCVLLKEIVWLGVSWRSEKTMTGLVQIKLDKRFQIGYSYDTPTASNVKGAQSVSHELMLNYRFGWKKGQTVAPRYF